MLLIWQCGVQFSTRNNHLKVRLYVALFSLGCYFWKRKEVRWKYMVTECLGQFGPTLQLKKTFQWVSVGLSRLAILGMRWIKLQTVCWGSWEEWCGIWHAPLIWTANIDTLLSYQLKASPDHLQKVWGSGFLKDHSLLPLLVQFHFLHPALPASLPLLYPHFLSPPLESAGMMTETAGGCYLQAKQGACRKEYMSYCWDRMVCDSS